MKEQTRVWTNITFTQTNYELSSNVYSGYFSVPRLYHINDTCRVSRQYGFSCVFSGQIPLALLCYKRDSNDTLLHGLIHCLDIAYCLVILKLYLQSVLVVLVPVVFPILYLEILLLKHKHEYCLTKMDV